MPKFLSDGRQKLTLLTVPPANPDAPTATELNAGVDVSCDVLASDFNWTAVDSDKIQEKALCDESNANALGASNYTAGLTFFRYFDETTMNSDLTEDAGYQTVKRKGTTVLGYLRENGKKSADPWAADDEISLGLEVITDTPQRLDGGGYIKRRIPMEPQRGWSEIVVAAGA